MPDTISREGSTHGGPWGELRIVATPIGNLDDFSPRGRDSLAGAHVILCEDTRRTLQLTTALGIHGRLERLDQNATPQVLERVIERLKEGLSFALVSDAGTPAISDPAAALVARAHEEGIRVMPIVGPSAVTALLSVAGFQETAFAFHGFFPRKEGDRSKLLQTLQRSHTGPEVHVWFESPERILSAMRAVESEMPQARCTVAKELTKVYEAIFSGSVHSVSQQLASLDESGGVLGEWCFAIQIKPHDSQKKNAQKRAIFTQAEVSGASGGHLDWLRALKLLIEAQVKSSVAARMISQEFGVDRKLVYSEALKNSPKK